MTLRWNPFPQHWHNDIEKMGMDQKKWPLVFHHALWLSGLLKQSAIFHGCSGLPFLPNLKTQAHLFVMVSFLREMGIQSLSVSLQGYLFFIVVQFSFLLGLKNLLICIQGMVGSDISLNKSVSAISMRLHWSCSRFNTSIIVLLLIGMLVFRSSSLWIGRDLIVFVEGCAHTLLIFEITLQSSIGSCLSPRALLMILWVVLEVPSAPVGMNLGSVMLPPWSASILSTSPSSWFVLLSMTAMCVSAKSFLVLLLTRSQPAWHEKHTPVLLSLISISPLHVLHPPGDIASTSTRQWHLLHMLNSASDCALSSSEMPVSKQRHKLHDLFSVCSLFLILAAVGQCLCCCDHILFQQGACLLTSGAIEVASSFCCHDQGSLQRTPWGECCRFCLLALPRNIVVCFVLSIFSSPFLEFRWPSCLCCWLGKLGSCFVCSLPVLSFCSRISRCYIFRPCTDETSLLVSGQASLLPHLRFLSQGLLGNMIPDLLLQVPWSLNSILQD